MGIEGQGKYSRKAYEETGQAIEELAGSVDEKTPVKELRSRLEEQETLKENKERLYGEAWDEALEENAARDTRKAADHAEAARLLEQLRENAGITTEEGPEKSAETREPKRQQESFEERRDSELRELFKNLDREEWRKGQDYLAESESGEAIRQRVTNGLFEEGERDKKVRGKVIKAAAYTGFAAGLAGIGGTVATMMTGSAEASLLGFPAAQLIMDSGLGLAFGSWGLGAVGWAGMKLAHSWKEWKHRKALDQNYTEYHPLKKKSSSA